MMYQYMYMYMYVSQYSTSTRVGSYTYVEWVLWYF